MEIDSIESELQQFDRDLLASQAQEEKFKKDEEDTNNEDEYSDMEVDDDNDPDRPNDSIENKDSTDLNDIVKKLMDGENLSDPAQITNVTTDTMLRHTQKVIYYKNGFSKPAIIVDTKISK